MSLPDREVTVDGDKHFVEFESLQEAMAGAYGPELLVILKQLHGLAFGYNVMDMGAYSRLRKKTDEVIRAASRK